MSQVNTWVHFFSLSSKSLFLFTALVEMSSSGETIDTSMIREPTKTL